MIEIDKSKFDTIEYNDIRLGDELLLVVQQDTGMFVVESKAHNRLPWREWELENGWIINAEPDLPGETVTLYRRKKPFKFPTGQGAVILGHSKDTRQKRTFVRVGECWIRPDIFGQWSQASLAKTFDKFETLSEGVNL